MAINDYLLNGRETKLAFLGAHPEEVKDLGKSGELREVVIKYWQNRYAPVKGPATTTPLPNEAVEKSWSPPWWLAGVVGVLLGAGGAYLARRRVRG